MFCAIIVLPNPLRPTRTRLRESGMKSSERARSMISRSILLGQVHSKSARGLNFLMPENRSRRSKLRRERSLTSAWASCSSKIRGDQRDLVALARKSSRSAGNAHKPICWSCAARLGIGFIVVVACEFIVGLQVVRPKLDRLSLGIAAQIDGQWRMGRRSTQFTEQKGNGRGARRISFQRFTDGSTQRGSAIQVQQSDQLSGLAARRFSLCEGQIQQGFTLRNGLGQTAGGRRGEGLPLGPQQGLLVSRIQHWLVTIVTAAMAGDLGGAIQNPHQRVGGHQRQLSAHSLGRDGVVVEIEANIDGLGGAYRDDQIRAEWGRRGRQQAQLFLVEDLFDCAGTVSRPGPLMGDLIPP